MGFKRAAKVANMVKRRKEKKARTKTLRYAEALKQYYDALVKLEQQRLEDEEAAQIKEKKEAAKAKRKANKEKKEAKALLEGDLA